MTTIDDTTTPWSAEKAKHYRATARQCFQHSYDHGSIADPDNCSGCALRVIDGDDGPNYAGWARIYIEAGGDSNLRLPS